jgi:hypothetical protein
MRILRIVPSCTPDLLAHMVPAIPEERTWVVLTESFPKSGVHDRFLCRFAGANTEAWGTIIELVEDFAKIVSRVV